jgi:integrase
MDWTNRVIFNPDSKTGQGRRFIPMSDRVYDILRARCGDRKEGWSGSHATRASKSARPW